MKKVGVLVASMLIMAVLPTSSLSWRYDVTYDRMREEQTEWAHMESSNTLSFGFPYQGGSKVSLALAKNKHQGLSVILKVDKGQFNCSSLEPCRVYAKLDTGEVLHFYGNIPTDGKADMLFISPEAKMVDLLRKSKHLTIEAGFFQEGSRQMEFDVSDLQWGSEEGAKDAAQGSSFGSPEGNGAITAAVQLYCERVRSAIRQEFKSPDQYVGNLETTVSLVVNKDGHIISLQVEKPSGNSFLDAAAVRAIQNANIPAIPPALDRPKQDFRITFSSLGVS
jgi:TonB family protein